MLDILDIDEDVYLTYEEAVASLQWQEDGSVHTFVDVLGGLIGTDRQREEVEQILREGSPQLAGDVATSLKHGIVAFRNGTPIFLETIPDPED